jgi:hypothetical protein
MALDGDRMIHATAFAMAVIIEPIMTAIARIDASGQGPFLGARRPALAATAHIPLGFPWLKGGRYAASLGPIGKPRQ